jgi:hypothetical protein
MVGNKPYAVAVVVDPAFGGRLSDLASRMHVWCIDTPDNRAAAEIVWHQNEQAQSIERGVTIFSADLTDPPDEIVASELDTIDLHHGEYSHIPPYSVLHVYGASPTSVLGEALAGLGFINIVPTAEGFAARRE